MEKEEKRKRTLKEKWNLKKEKKRKEKRKEKNEERKIGKLAALIS